MYDFNEDVFTEKRGMVNHYVCDHQHRTITVNAANGVTPFIIGCDVCGNEAGSSFYRVPQAVESATHEWYRPEPADLESYAAGQAAAADLQDAPEDLREQIRAQIAADIKRAVGMGQLLLRRLPGSPDVVIGRDGAIRQRLRHG